MACDNKNTNTSLCNCTYPGCPRKGICCECLQYHLKNDEMPACFFPPEAEKTYDRSIDYFIKVYQQKR